MPNGNNLLQPLLDAFAKFNLEDLKIENFAEVDENDDIINIKNTSKNKAIIELLLIIPSSLSQVLEKAEGVGADELFPALIKNLPQDKKERDLLLKKVEALLDEKTGIVGYLFSNLHTLEKKSLTQIKDQIKIFCPQIIPEKFDGVLSSFSQEGLAAFSLTTLQTALIQRETEEAVKVKLSTQERQIHRLQNLCQRYRSHLEDQTKEKNSEKQKAIITEQQNAAKAIGEKLIHSKEYSQKEPAEKIAENTSILQNAKKEYHGQSSGIKKDISSFDPLGVKFWRILQAVFTVGIYPAVRFFRSPERALTKELESITKGEALTTGVKAKPA